jgi:hypothetical protein
VEQGVVAAEPALERLEACAAAARLDLGRQRRGVAATEVEVNVGAIAAVPSGARQRHALGVDAALHVQLDDGALAAQPLVAGGFAHQAASNVVGTGSAGTAPCGRGLTSRR